MGNADRRRPSRGVRETECVLRRVPVPFQGMLLGPVRLITTLVSRPSAPGGTATHRHMPSPLGGALERLRVVNGRCVSGSCIHQPTRLRSAATAPQQGRAGRRLNPKPDVPASPSTDGTPPATALPPSGQCAGAPLGSHGPPWLRMRVAPSAVRGGGHSAGGNAFTLRAARGRGVSGSSLQRRLALWTGGSRKLLRNQGKPCEKP